MASRSRATKLVLAGLLGAAGWTVGSVTPANWGGVGDDHLLVTPPDGSQQAVVLYYVGAGTVSQTVQTVPGATYLLSWYGTGYPHGPGTTKVMDVLWDSNVVATPSYDVSGHTMADPGWKLQHLVVTATSPSSVVEFGDASAPPSLYASMVGNVSLAGDASIGGVAGQRAIDPLCTDGVYCMTTPNHWLHRLGNHLCPVQGRDVHGQGLPRTE